MNCAEYMLDRLKMLCEELVARAACEENVAQLLEAAYRYNARRLRAACIAVVSTRPGLLDSASFRSLPAVAIEEVKAFLGSST